MRVFPGVCLLLLGIGSGLGAADLAGARLRLLKGNHEEAREQYEELLADAKTAPAAAVGISRVHQSRGEYDPALAVVDKALAQAARNPDLLARRGELLHLAGRWDEAMKVADEALAVDARHLPARWVRAQILRDRGDIKEADAEIKKMVRQYSDVVNTDKEIKDPELLLLVGMASAENARWNGLSDEFQAILEDLYGDAIKFDPAFWPAEYQAGLLLLEKYNRGEALDAFDKALKINPSAAEVLAARAVVAMGRYEMKDAERYSESALKVNPNLPEALRVRADVYLTVGDVPAALKELERARKIAPRDERTLARLAACHHLMGKKAEQQAIVAEVEKASKKPALFWFDFGERLEERRRFDEAEKCFRKASELRPELSGPLNSLGLLYMRLGKEAEAKQLLEKGFQADRFNVRVSNMRKVIQHLGGYEDLKTAHFVIRHDPKRDAVLARYIADQLESMYQELVKKFDYKPEGLIPIEIFRNHDMFSGRTVALPDLHTIGACTGKVVTMVSPNERNAKGEPARKPFNWSRVLRHELVHIFNLAQTNFLVPHWFTEGLAVANEGFPRPPSWNQLLLERVASNRLLNLDTIDLGFIRPRDPLEWQQAYAQAQLYVEYIEKKFGPQAVSKLLASFAAGKNTPEALQDALKTDKDTFEAGYRAHLDEVVKELRGNRPAEKRRTLEQLQAEYKKDPRDAEVASELAQRLVSTRRAEARKIAEEVLERQPSHPRALYTLSLLARRAADSKQERTLLEKALNKEQPDPLILRPLGKLYYEQNEFALAAEMYELARKVDRFDRDTLLELARIYAQLQDPSKQIAVLKEVVPLDADDLDRRVRLARLLSEQGDFAGAERYARQALEIDVLHPEARELLWAALKKQNKGEEEARLRKLLAGDTKEP